MSGVIRDFSQQSVLELCKIIKKNLDNGQWGLFDWFHDTVSTRELNIRNYLNNVNEYHAQMMDRHNMGFEEFDKIYKRVHIVDINYASRFNSLADRVTALYTRIEHLTEMINPSVITANPSDFAKLADGISSNYNNVKVQSDAEIKKCEEFMPVLYDKQWYENVADDANTAGQVIQGVGLGLVDVGKGLIQGPVDIAVGIYNAGQNLLSFCKNPDDKLTEWENYLKAHPAGLIQNYLNFKRELPSFLLNQVKKSIDDFAKADTKTKSETATSFIVNIALLFVPGSVYTKFFKAGEVAEVAEDVTKGEKFLEGAEETGKTVEEGEKLAEAEQKAAAEAAKAAATIQGGLNANFGKNIENVLSKYSISVEKFNDLRLKNVANLTKSEKAMMKSIRESIPMPDSTTEMQRVIPADDINKYLEGSYSKVNGYITREQDVTQLKNYDDMYNSLRLDYPNSEYNPLTDDTLGVIKFKTPEANEIKIPYSKEMGGSTVAAQPFAGNGFTKAINGQIIPEYKCDDLLKIADGSELYEISKNGTEKLRAVYDAKLKRFIATE